jgi:hypothetical protein
MRKTVLAAALVAALVLPLAGCNFSFSTAKVEQACMTTAVDEDGKPVDSVRSYPADTETVYAAALLKNAPNNTQLRIVWTYVTTGEKIAETPLDSGDISSRYITATLKPRGLLPVGDYKVEFFVEERKDPDATVEFSVTAAEGTVIKNAHMTSGFDANGNPLDIIDTVDVKGEWIVCAALHNTQPGTIVYFVWRTPDGEPAFEYDFDPQGKSDVYISCTLKLANEVPEGLYSVDIYVDENEEPSATVEFNVKAQ